jgi:hypothetical protein
MAAKEFLKDWFERKGRYYQLPDEDDIEDIFLYLAERTEADSERQFRRLIPRAIYLSVNREVKAEYRIAEYIGKLVEDCSENKKVQREVQDIFFEVMLEKESWELMGAFLESIKIYNTRHGYLGRHKLGKMF